MILPVERKDLCEEHPDEICRLYCNKCKSLICCECQFGDHKDHDIALARTVVEQLRGEVKGSKQKLQEMQKDVAKCIDELKEDSISMEKKHKDELADLQKFPSVDKSYNYLKQEVKFMAAWTGQLLAASLEIPHPTTLTVTTIGQLNCNALVSGGSKTHYLVNLYQQSSDQYTQWWLPSSLTVGQAVSQAAGASPSRITDYNSDQDVQQQTVEQWLGSAQSANLKYCM